jgi:hypothetical protein
VADAVAVADVAAPVVIEPGVYPDLDAELYHADPVPGGSLSCSGAKKLLPPSCPAIFDYERKNPPASKAVFDEGHAAHQAVLGVGPEIVVIPGDRWDTKEAKAAVAAAREAGQVPVKADVKAMVDAMDAQLRAHPIASALLGDGGMAETSIFWRDEASGVMRRCRLDWRPAPRSGRTIGVDYKTARSADPEKFAKAAAEYGYHCQHAWYVDGMSASRLAGEDATFVFIAQEKTPPFLVSVIELDVTAVRIGRLLNRRAINVYAECDRTGVWPGYTNDVAHVSLPFWYERNFEDQL